jgi:hypothetical protein
MPRVRDLGDGFSVRRELNSPINAHQVNLQRSFIERSTGRFAGVTQLFCVYGRDKSLSPVGYQEVEISVAQRLQE